MEKIKRLQKHTKKYNKILVNYSNFFYSFILSASNNKTIINILKKYYTKKYYIIHTWNIETLKASQMKHTKTT